MVKTKAGVARVKVTKIKVDVEKEKAKDVVKAKEMEDVDKVKAMATAKAMAKAMVDADKAMAKAMEDADKATAKAKDKGVIPSPQLEMTPVGEHLKMEIPLDPPHVLRPHVLRLESKKLARRDPPMEGILTIRPERDPD